jgi:hypothetical protein
MDNEFTTVKIKTSILQKVIANSTVNVECSIEEYKVKYLRKF